MTKVEAMEENQVTLARCGFVLNCLYVETDKAWCAAEDEYA